jgi:hypothetical protein
MSLGDDSIDPAQLLEPDEGQPDEAMHPSVDSVVAPKQSRLISRVLAPAVGLWVRSQLEHVEDLQITLEAGDRQLLGGGIRRVVAAASKAVYRGLHFSHIQVAGEEIQTNLGQVLRGKPFRLLAAFPVIGEVTLTEADLNASLNAPLLADAITDFLLTFLQQTPQPSEALLDSAATLQDVKVQLGDDALTFTALLVNATHTTPIAIRTRLAIKKGNLLKLEGFQYQQSVDELVSSDACKTNFTIPLGNDVDLETLSIQVNRLRCQGRVTVTP